MIIDNQREKAFEVRKKFPHIPLFAIELWIRNCILQGNEGSLDVFISDPYASRHGGGFCWANSPQQHEFWNKLLQEQQLPSSLSDEIDKVSDYIDFNLFK